MLSSIRGFLYLPVAVLIGMGLTQAVLGQDVYKVIDEDGNITYSSEPPESGQAAAIIEAMPEPSEADIQAAQKRQQKIEEDFERLDETRAEQAAIEAQQRANNNTTVVQSNTVIGRGYYPRYYPHTDYWYGVPGAPTAPGYRPPGYNRPGNRPRPLPADPPNLRLPPGLQSGP